MVSLCHYPYFSLLVSLVYSTVTFRTKWVSFVHITFQQNNCIVFCQLLNNFAARYYLLIGLNNLNCLLWKLLCTDRESLLKRFYRAVIDFAEEITTGCSSLIVVNSIRTRGLRCLYFVSDGKDSLNTLPVKSTIQRCNNGDNDSHISTNEGT